MDRIRESRNRAPCDKIFPEIPDDGPEGHGCRRSIPAPGCGREVSEICIYGKLLNEEPSKQNLNACPANIITLLMKERL